jgi:hypothetical protein
VQHPDSVKVDEEMNGASLLQISLEEGFAPVDLVELHEPLSGRDVNQTGLVRELDPGDTLGVPEQLVDIVVTDNLVVVSLPPQELAVDDLVPLVSKEPVQGLDNAPQVETLGNGLDPVLAFRASIVVVGALEDEAQTFRGEPDLGGFTPAQEEQGDLPQPVVL